MKLLMTTTKSFYTFNEYFTNITKGLNLRQSTGKIHFENEQRCKKIKKNFGNKNFSSEKFLKKDGLNLIKEISGNKTTVSNDIPDSVIKESISSYYVKLTDFFINCIRSNTFPEIHKKAEVAPVFRKGDSTSKTDCHP